VKILWLNAGLLLPLDKGGKLRTWHLMRHLAAQHDITYVSFCDPDHDPADREGMAAVCSRIETIPRADTPKGTLRFKAEAAASVLSPLPYAIGKYRSAAFRKTVRDLLARDRFDLIVCDFLFPAVNLPRRLPCPAAIFTHNVESEIWRRHAETKQNPIARALFGLQARRMLRYESRALSRFDLILTVSGTDRDTLRELYGASISAPIHVVRTGVDTAYFHPLPHVPVNPAHLVFTGSMDWLPNEDGIQWFCRDVLPVIKRDVPQVTLSIVGRSPSPAVKSLESVPGVRVTGRVDDVRPFIRESAVFVVPLRVGGGTRLKIFEAMAMAKAVVSTTVGAEGLPVTHDRDILLADDAGSFARAVVRLLRDGNERRQLESAARALVAQHFDWSAVAHDLDVALTRCAQLDIPDRRASAARTGVGLLQPWNTR
jgi:sugar transferase (PEP-CTERM/EpsH1 system associated)